jgi:uncharacterized protein
MADEATGAAGDITRTRFEVRPPGGGPPLRGDLRVRAGAEPTSAVVICHGFKGFREWGFFPALAKAAAAAGHAAVGIDFSRNGVGADGVDFSALDLFRENTLSRDVDEIRATLDVLTTRRLLPRVPVRIGLFGHSRGGGEAVIAAAEDARVDALVTWAAVATFQRWQPEQVDAWRRGEAVEIENARTGQQMPIGPTYWRDLEENADRLDVEAAAARVRAPWLIVHGDADASVAVGDAHRLFDAAPESAELLVVEGADHTFGARHPYAGATPELRTATDATLEWFEQHLC